MRRRAGALFLLPLLPLAVPGFQVPPFVSRIAVRSTMDRQFRALVQEIVRRELSVRGDAR